MFDLSLWIQGLYALLVFGAIGWLVGLLKEDVSIVDSMWSVMFLIAAIVYVLNANPFGPRAALIVVLVAIWAARLSVYITARNHGKGEDYRYKRIRANNSPNFGFKSLYIVFGLQGFLAWIISLPLLAAATGQTQVGLFDYAGIALWLVGFTFEAVSDYQLARFKSRSNSNREVFRSGLWRYTRHPNYFGNFCIWWGFYLIAVGAGGWWSIVSPVLMSFLLLKVSGVAMLERDIADRRPGYRDYVMTTNAFFPGAVKQR